MTPGQLVKAVSIALGLPEETVVQHDRNLVVAGLRTTGARGINAPSVTHRDAARLFVTALASIRVKDSADVLLEFEKAEFSAPSSEGDLFALFKGNAPQREHNFVDAIASLIGNASGPDHVQHLERLLYLSIACELPSARARIHGVGINGGNSAAYRGPKSIQKRDGAPPYARYASLYGITQRREAWGTALILLGRAFRDLNFASPKEALSDFLRQPLDKQFGRKQARVA
jgi:hypothetical protein